MVNQLLHADGTGLKVDYEASSQNIVVVFGNVCWRRNLNVNVSTRTLTVVAKYGECNTDVYLNGERMEAVETQMFGRINGSC